MNAILEEWAIAPVTGGRTSPDELDKLSLDKASEIVKKKARKREIDQAVQDRILECRSWGGKGEEIIIHLSYGEKS